MSRGVTLEAYHKAIYGQWLTPTLATTVCIPLTSCPEEAVAPVTKPVKKSSSRDSEPGQGWPNCSGLFNSSGLVGQGLAGSSGSSSKGSGFGLVQLPKLIKEVDPPFGLSYLSPSNSVRARIKGAHFLAILLVWGAGVVSERPFLGYGGGRVIP